MIIVENYRFKLFKVNFSKEVKRQLGR